MYPIYNIQGIENEEKKIEEKHVVMLLIVKPQDRNANEIISRINYWHWLSGRYCQFFNLFSRLFRASIKQISLYSHLSLLVPFIIFASGYFPKNDFE